MKDLSHIINKYLEKSKSNKSIVEGTDVYEYYDTVVDRITRSTIIDNIILELKENEEFKDYSIIKKASITISGKNFKSGKTSMPLLMVIKENDSKSSKTLALLKLTPGSKFKIRPSDLGITRSGSPNQENCYLSFETIIDTIGKNVDLLVDEEKISAGLSEWIKVHLAMFNPSDLSSGKRQKIRKVWNPELEDQITSELLEIFCGLGYIKGITTPFSGQGAIISVSKKEKQRVVGLIGENPPKTSFRIWFPQSGNYPIIDSQVGYFEGNQLKAVFPISTKNITANRPTNTIKFKDIFTNKRQALEWKKGLPKKSSDKQGLQTVVASQAVGQPSKQNTLYPLYAAKSILNSNLTNSANKRQFIQSINEYGSNFNETQIKTILTNLTSSRYSRSEKLNNILSGNILTNAKELIYILLQKTKGTNSPYSNVCQTYQKSYLLSVSEDVWNSTVKGRGFAEYPYTYGNISLFFEKVLEKNSVHHDGPTNYLRMVSENYFTANRALMVKYGNVPPPSGAGDVILSKISVGLGGIVRISYNSKTNTGSKYGVRSKNSLNNLQDALGISF